MADGGPTSGDGRITIRTVAADAGVSEALRLKVEASIGKLGYRPSVGARGMRGQTFTLGVLLVGIDNPFLPAVFQAIETIAEAAGYKIMVGVGAARARTEVQLIEQMIDNRMDGLILVATQISGKTLDHYARQIPIVVIGHHEPAALSYDTINNDDRAGAAMVVRALLERGYRDITFVAPLTEGDHSADVSPQREFGFFQAMAEAGLQDHARVLRLPQHGPARADEIRQLLSVPDRPRALCCWSDLDAIPLLSAAHGMGIKVPQDIAVVGYDNSPTAALSMVDLASIDQDGPRLGKLSAEALLSRINGRKTAEHFLIAPTLILRGSL